MFPLNDTEPNRYSHVPAMTLTLIGLNVLVLFFENVLGKQSPTGLYTLMYFYGTVPKLVLNQEGAGALSSLTSMFLHGGVFHLVSNMLALWVFGRRVEDACGPWRFLCFYLLAGVSADILSIVVSSGSSRPSIGASGAVFGVMGAYLLLFPGGRIRTLVFISFIPLFPKIRAIWIILYFVAVQVVPAVNVLLQQTRYGVNYWAHLSGFFACLLIFLFLRPEAFARYWNDEPI